MRVSGPTEFFGSSTNPIFELRVRGTKSPTYLWGSDGLAANVTFEKPLVLHIRNDPFGEEIEIGTLTTSGAEKSTTKVGVLQPGQSVSIPIQNISGVSATCQKDSLVSCLIKS